MTRLERLQEKRATFHRQWMEAVSKYRTVQAHTLSAKIAALDAEIEEAERYAPKRMSELVDRETLDRLGIADSIIRTHLAADFLNDCVGDLRERLDKAGLQWCNLFEYAQTIEKASGKYAAFIATPEFGQLCDLVVSDDELIDNLHKALNDYIKSKATVIKTEKCKIQ